MIPFQFDRSGYDFHHFFVMRPCLPHADRQREVLPPAEVPPIAGLRQPGDGRSAKATIQPRMTTIEPAATEPRVAGRE